MTRTSRTGRAAGLVIASAFLLSNSFAQEPTAGTDPLAGTLGIEDFSDLPGSPTDTGAASVVINHEELYFSFDGTTGPGKIYQSETCTALVGGLTAYPCVKYVPGIRGQAVELGKGATIAVQDDLDPRKVPQVTMTAWIKRTDNSHASGFLFSDANGSGGYPHLGFYGGKLTAKAGRFTMRFEDQIAQPPLDEWTFVAAVWDYQARTLRVYSGDSSVTYSDLQMDTAPGSRDIPTSHPTFAAPGAASTEKQPYYFIGGSSFKHLGRTTWSTPIDEVRVFKRALSDDEIATLRSGGTLAQAQPGVAIGETEKNNPRAPAFPSGGPGVIDPVKSIGGSVGGGVLGQGTTDTAASRQPTSPVSGQTQGVLEERASQGTIPQPTSGASGGASDPSSGGTRTTQQALQPAGPHPVGDPVTSNVSGFNSGKSYIIDLVDKFMVRLGWDEKADVPCRLGVFANGGHNRGVELDCPKTVQATILVPFYSENTVDLDGAAVGRLQVCNNGNANQRMKGVRIWGDVINDDGSTVYLQHQDEKSLPNCANWDASVMCPLDTLATGVIVYASDTSGSNEQIVGLSLICRHIGVN